MKYLITISFLLSFVIFSQSDSLNTIADTVPPKPIILNFYGGCQEVEREIPQREKDSLFNLYKIRMVPVLEDSLTENKDNIIFGERFEISPIYPGGPNAMRNFIDSNFVYPPKEINNISGMVWVQFWIDTIGVIDSVEVVKGLTLLIDAEAKRVVESFPNFIPGSFAGKKVPVKYNVPVKVKYVENKVVYHYPPDLPAEFPEENGDINVYLWNNLDFSKCDLTLAMSNSRVVIGFIVEKDETLSNIHIIKGISSEIDNEVLRVFKLMPKWLPAESKGEPISTDIEFPIRIRVG